ncbi:DNA topoisomerase 2-beta [Dermatophagoides farinae]|uniref:DNA topoisomerase (ATP-hydrolyzing) n=1 Tax=Dermatophagoides farinae TaxID=6954 RepID=A0A922HN36_DERFA|nr:DNA topoisomerase 2-beta [Dermatophagoides farinae]
MYNKHVNENKTDQNVSLKWHHITVYSPYRGGLWERAVKTVEETMQAMSFGKSYKFEEFVSQISDVQYIVNSRSGANDFDAPITPLMMLKGDRNSKSLGIVGLATLQMNIIDNNQNNGNLSIIKNITQNDDDNNNDYNNIVNDKNIDISSSSATINQNNSNTTNNNNNKLHTGCKKRGRKRKLPISNDNNKPVVVNNNNSNDDLSTTTITTIVTNPVKPINDNDNNQFNNGSKIHKSFSSTTTNHQSNGLNQNLNDIKISDKPIIESITSSSSSSSPPSLSSLLSSSSSSSSPPKSNGLDNRNDKCNVNHTQLKIVNNLQKSIITNEKSIVSSSSSTTTAAAAANVGVGSIISETTFKANDTKILKTTPANVDIKYEIPEGNLIRVEPRRGRPPKIKQTSTSFTTIQNQQVPRLSPLVLSTKSTKKLINGLFAYFLFKKIPSLVDGFKPVQRKIIHTCFKRDDQRAVKLLQLAGTVYELCAYHHNEMYLMETIIRFAQNFTGSNNINQLRRHGQFGTRFEGGTDAAQPPSNLVPN